MLLGVEICFDSPAIVYRLASNKTLYPSVAKGDVASEIIVVWHLPDFTFTNSGRFIHRNRSLPVKNWIGDSSIDNVSNWQHSRQTNVAFVCDVVLF